MAKLKKAGKQVVDGPIGQERRQVSRRRTDLALQRKIAEFRHSLKNEKRGGS